MLAEIQEAMKGDRALLRWLKTESGTSEVLW
jgi:hypothetical protein